MQTLFITGATSGIGKELARAFQRKGCTVIILGRDKTKLEKIVQENPGLHYEVLDVRDFEQVQACAKRIKEKYGTIQTLINNAGVQSLLEFSPAHTHTREELDDEIDTNLKGLIYVTEVIPPVVKTLLHRKQTREVPYAMELNRFIEETMKSLESHKSEVPIGMAKKLRFASRWMPKAIFGAMNAVEKQVN
ncbi:MAG: SDR family NAD(P)-dependent oxidoreductase [Bdellovibrionales bacterium]|nr:SDR family NAD(P)-dependent oxidoreductase [Bdellovibrionales bacterium]